MTEPIRAGTVNLARLMAETETRAQAIAAEINSMQLDVIGFQETEEWLEKDLLRMLDGTWAVASDNVNCPTFARTDLFETVKHNGKAWIPITMPGSVRKRYGSAAMLQRKADGLLFVFATIHPSNNGESSHAAEDRIKQAESCWQHFVRWGVTDFPIVLVGDMNTREMPPRGLPGVFAGHGMTDVLQALGQKPRIDRAFVLGFTPISATVNTVASSASDHDFGVFVVAPGTVVPEPPEVRLHGVDVSGYQPGWTPTPSDAFVFVKSTQGTTYQNPHRSDQLAAGRAGNLQIGHYHYLAPDNAVPQARYFAANTDIHAGDLLACDWEGIWKKGTHPSVDDAAQFIAEVKRLLPENRVGLYCNRSDWNDTTVKAGDFLWIAEYGVKAPAIKAQWDFWQYNDKPIDMNLSRFLTVDELKAWAHITPPTPKPPQIPPAVEPPVELPPVPPTIRHSDKYKADYVWYGKGGGHDGGWIPVNLVPILDAVAKATGKKIRLSQGGLSNSVPASGQTHNGLGSFDIPLDGRTKGESWALASALLRSGVACFPRGFTWDSFQGKTLENLHDGIEHLHCVSWENYANLHRSAQLQIDEYLKGGDGLKGSAKYTGPSTKLEHWATSPYNPRNVTPDVQTYVVDVGENGFLWGLDVDRKKVTKQNPGAVIQTDRRITRWDRINAVTPAGIYYSLDYLSIAAPSDVGEQPTP